MFTIWTIYLFAATAASGALVAMGRRGNHGINLASPPAGNADPAKSEEPASHPAFAASTQGRADVSAAMRLALKRLAPVMASQSVRAEIAAPPGLFARLRATALADLLEELPSAAVHAAPASRLLFTAAPRGDRIYITVTDDMPGADPAVRLASVRTLMQRVALCGGALDVDVCLQEGTSMTLRFAAVTADRQEKQDQSTAERLKTVQPAAMALGA